MNTYIFDTLMLLKDYINTGQIHKTTQYLSNSVIRSTGRLQSLLAANANTYVCSLKSARCSLGNIFFKPQGRSKFRIIYKKQA